MVLIFTNNKISNFRNYLSQDRWEVYTINLDAELVKTDADYKYVNLDNLTKK